MNGTIKIKTLVCVFVVGLVSCFLGMEVLGSSPRTEVVEDLEKESVINNAVRKTGKTSYSFAYKNSDLVVIASAYQTKDTKDIFSRRNNRGIIEDYLLGQETKFQTAVVLKGDKKIKEFTLLHFRMKADRLLFPNGPRLVSFSLGEKTEQPIFINVPRGNEYLLFLEKRKDGRYEVFSIKFDPADTIIKLTSSKYNSRIKSESKTEEGIETALTAGDSKETDQKGTVTVDGEDVTPEEKEALTNMVKELFSKAFSKAMQEVFSEMIQKLDLSSDVELKLIDALPKLGEVEPDGGPVSIYLIKPGKFSDGSQTIVWALGGKRFIRLTRASGPVNRPVAIITHTGVLNGQPAISEWVLVYNKDGKWEKQRPSKRTENTAKK